MAGLIAHLRDEVTAGTEICVRSAIWTKPQDHLGGKSHGLIGLGIIGRQHQVAEHQPQPSIGHVKGRSQHDKVDHPVHRFTTPSVTATGWLAKRSVICTTLAGLSGKDGGWSDVGIGAAAGRCVVSPITVFCLPLDGKVTAISRRSTLR